VAAIAALREAGDVGVLRRAVGVPLLVKLLRSLFDTDAARMAQLMR